MGNGTTCNLQLVKQNAKKKGEVSTRLFFAFFSFCVFPSALKRPARAQCPSASAPLNPAPTTAAAAAECEPLFTGIKSARMEVKDLGGPEGREEKKRKEGGDTEEATCGASRRRAASKRRRERGGATPQRRNLFITTAPSLSPSRTANANVGHLGKK